MKYNCEKQRLNVADAVEKMLKDYIKPGADKFRLCPGNYLMEDYICHEVCGILFPELRMFIRFKLHDCVTKRYTKNFIYASCKCPCSILNLPVLNANHRIKWLRNTGPFLPLIRGF